MRTLDPRDGDWCKELEKSIVTGHVLPDCRVKPIEREHNRVQIGRMMWDKVFCADCGTVYGASPPNSPFVFYVCDLCVRKKGSPPGAIQTSG